MVERERYPEQRRENNLQPKAIVILGSGFHLSEVTKTGVKLSPDQRMRLWAGLQLQKELSEVGNPPEMFICCGGQVFSREEWGEKRLMPSLSAYMKDELVRRGIPEQSVLKERDSLNTVEDFNQAMKMIEDGGLFPAVVISDRFHFVARVLAKRKGLKYVSAESLLSRRNRRYQKIIRSLTCRTKFLEFVVNQVKGTAFLLLRGEENYTEKVGREKGDVIATEFDPYWLGGKNSGKIAS
jgi:uncharacterized SAM-binding protein YcdF (DUF218 family)